MKDNGQIPITELTELVSTLGEVAVRLALVKNDGLHLLVAVADAAPGADQEPALFDYGDVILAAGAFTGRFLHALLTEKHGAYAGLPFVIRLAKRRPPGIGIQVDRHQILALSHGHTSNTKSLPMTAVTPSMGVTSSLGGTHHRIHRLAMRCRCSCLACPTAITHSVLRCFFCVSRAWKPVLHNCGLGQPSLRCR